MEYFKVQTNEEYRYIASLFCDENNQFLIRKKVSWKDVLKEHEKNPNIHTYILEVEKTRIGWISLTFNSQTKKVSFGMIIHKPFQGRGYGSEALHILEKEARKLGAVEIELDVLEQNNPALAIYKKAGFLETQRMIKMHKIL